LDLDEVSTLASRKSTAGNWPYFAILLPIQRKNQSGKVVETQDRPHSKAELQSGVEPEKEKAGRDNVLLLTMRPDERPLYHPEAPA
jgi:hypothetical protein